MSPTRQPLRHSAFFPKTDHARHRSYVAGAVTPSNRVRHFEVCTGEFMRATSFKMSKGKIVRTW